MSNFDQLKSKETETVHHTWNLPVFEMAPVSVGQWAWPGGVREGDLGHCRRSRHQGRAGGEEVRLLSRDLPLHRGAPQAQEGLSGLRELSATRAEEFKLYAELKFAI